MHERVTAGPEGLGDELHIGIIKVNMAKIGRTHSSAVIPKFPGKCENFIA